MSNSTAYVAADTADGSLAAWTPQLASADAELYGEKNQINARARDLIRNYPVASGGLRTLTDNVIGSQLKLSSRPDYRLLGKNIDWAHDWANQWESEFATWGDTTECDIARSQDFLGLTRQAVSGAYVNGDHFALVLWEKRPDAKWSTRLQSIEADRVATPPWLSSKKNLRDGVEINDYGAPVAYWIAKQHPGDRIVNLKSANQDDWTRVPAFTPWGRRRVIHLYNKERAGQNRGKSIFAPVMRELKVSWDYLSSELRSAAVNSLVAFFLESDLNSDEVAAVFAATPNNADLGDPNASVAATPADARWRQIVDKMNRKKLEGGMITPLPLGAKIHEHNFNRPGTSFDPFMEVINRLIGVGINLPFELVNNNFSKTNYSSARAALAEAWRYFLCERTWVDTTWLKPVTECVMEESLDAGRIEAPDFYTNKYAYTRAKWIYAGRGAIDPYKEARGNAEKLGYKGTTMEKLLAEDGEDFDDVVEQQAREKAKYQALGLTSPYDAALNARANRQPDPELDDENGDPKDDTDDNDEGQK